MPFWRRMQNLHGWRSESEGVMGLGFKQAITLE